MKESENTNDALAFRLFTYKPVGSKMTLDIMSADVECLDPGEYLNDKIIDFYLK